MVLTVQPFLAPKLRIRWSYPFRQYHVVAITCFLRNTKGLLFHGLRVFRLPLEADEIWTLLGCYAAYSSSSLPTVRPIFKGREIKYLDFLILEEGDGGIQGNGYLGLEDGPIRLSRNVGKELPL